MPKEDMNEGQRKHLFALLGEAGIKNREDRLSFARELLDISENDLTSFTQLHADEADDLIFATRAWKIIQTLRDLNGSLLKESISKVRRYYNYSHDEDVAQIGSEEPLEDSEPVNEEKDDQKPVRRPRRSGKAPTKNEQNREEINKKSRTRSRRSSKTRSGSFSSEEIDYDLD